jgi:IS1 family transposase
MWWYIQFSRHRNRERNYALWGNSILQDVSDISAWICGHRYTKKARVILWICKESELLIYASAARVYLFLPKTESYTHRYHKQYLQITQRKI